MNVRPILLTCILAVFASFPVLAQDKQAGPGPMPMPMMPMGGDMMMPFGAQGVKPMVLSKVDLEGKAITVVIEASQAVIALSPNCIVVRDGKTIKPQELTDQADVAGLYYPSTGSAAVAVVELSAEDRLSTIQATVRKVEGTELMLKQSLLDEFSAEGAVVVAGGKQGKLADLVAGDKIIVLLVGDQHKPEALLIVKADPDDASVKTVRARLAADRGDGAMKDRFLQVVAGRAKELTLSIDPKTRLTNMPTVQIQQGNGGAAQAWSAEELTLEDLKKKLEKQEKGLRVLVSSSARGGDEKKQFVDMLVILPADMMPGPGGAAGMFFRHD